ncbi:haloacid dehalogenase-like hydrolase-like protein [Angomonas deanei]|uniref:Sucrose-6F-phosphate phosphohydrolase/haloacid dehalogenase-like hydrolase, putative n=1 Tax=Angomonas deanei TaxID=59799 RepID=A0A7G2CKZ8_9TRYP|nr:haloacid dehalogenase-like hydrolase-like protein [Angomonas deanei]CAD2218902.1 Sucrose-6F-phosphate phosphohydrolase/haloacid dehalogenase-like hydrolase, putative [Angomonas deanei]|eukprot:EPY40893.1 haloacid dehalogenase-like hydrolase-like protein [Angomonas deanei]
MDSQSIKAIFVDLDGTLLNPEHRLSPTTLSVLERVHNEAGIPIIVATGRPYPDVFPKLKKVHLNPDYIITSNGARIHDSEHKKLFGIDLDPEAVLDILQLPAPPGRFKDGEAPPPGYEKPFTVNVNCESTWITDRCREGTRVAFEPEYTYAATDPLSYTAEDMKGTHSIWIYGVGEDLANVKAYVDNKWGDKVHTVYSTEVIVDCHHPAVNKATAVEEVCKRLGITPKDAVAFGDGMNDEKCCDVSERVS